MLPRPPRLYPVCFKELGFNFGGCWKVEEGELVVLSVYGQRREKLGRRNPQRYAERLLREIVLAWCEAKPAGTVVVRV